MAIQRKQIFVASWKMRRKTLFEKIEFDTISKKQYHKEHFEKKLSQYFEKGQIGAKIKLKKSLVLLRKQKFQSHF